MVFVKPGIYEFIGYKTGKVFSYTKYPGAISIFNKLNLKGGEVVYIGHLKVDLTKTKVAFKAMNFVKKKSLATKYLESTAPTLEGKMKYAPVTFTSLAEKYKDILSHMKKK